MSMHVCIYVCACGVYMNICLLCIVLCAGVHKHIFSCMWRPEIEFWCHFHNTILILETQLLTEPGIYKMAIIADQ